MFVISAISNVLKEEKSREKFGFGSNYRSSSSPTFRDPERG